MSWIDEVCETCTAYLPVVDGERGECHEGPPSVQITIIPGQEPGLGPDGTLQTRQVLQKQIESTFPPVTAKRPGCRRHVKDEEKPDKHTNWD